MPLTARKPAATPLNELTATEIVRAVTDGTTTCEAVARAHLERIAAREPQVQAWQYLDPEYVMTQARALDKRTPRGPLHGVPFAIKDIIDVAGVPTTAGSRLHAHRIAARDAACSGGPSGARAVSIVKSSAPSANTSARRSTGSPRACSGAMKPGVPITAAGSSSATALARPQSSTSTSPKAPTMTLAGFRSRWMTPRLWA